MASREQEVFERVVDSPIGERARLLEQECDSDAELIARVLALLDAHDRAAGFLEPTPGGPLVVPPTELLTGPTVPIAEGPGSTIGRYRLLQVIGEGGFGVVFMGEQSEPIRRRVALKVIKLGMDTRQVIARFEAERQALALMDHPSIARVLDAGATETGRPYFVMELVAGVPITEYADKNALGMRERLELLIPVCHAVQHAHHKGVIHRDLKPTNVLVTLQDGRAVPKVIDFGIAKAVNHRLTEKTLFTEFRQLIGTPEYMSPEQADMPGLDVDTRSDVFSLGVLMYELLVGATPLDATSLRSKGFAEMQKTIRESEPPRPANRFATLGAQRDDVAKRRRSDAAALSRELVGEPEWVVMKCLERDRTRRYETPAALAEDIGRMLRSEPVRAAPPSRAYTMRKFVRRHRRQVALGLIAAGLFLGGLAGTSIGMTWALRERNAAVLAKRAEKERADQLAQVSGFQAQMLAQIDTTKAGVELMADVRERFTAELKKAGVPEAERAARAEALRQELGRVNATDTAASMIDRTILKPAIKTIDEQFKSDPSTDASLRQSLADLYRTIGLYDAAMPLQESALAKRRSVLGEEHEHTLESINNLGFLLLARGKPDQAEPYSREALEKSRRVLGEEHPVTLNAMNNMGALLQAQGKREQAEPYYREALEKRRRVLGEEHPDTLDSISNMGSLLRARGKADQAEPYWREALEKRRRVLGEEHPDTLTSINNLGVLLRAQGKLDKAEPYYREALEKSRRVLGEEHPGTLTYMNNLAALLRLQDKLDQAEPYCREALEKRRRVLGDEHPNTLISISNLGTLLLARGEPDQAEPHIRETLKTRRRVLGEEHQDTLTSIGNLSTLLRAQNKLDEAELYGREALEKRRRVLGDEHPDTLSSVSSMARLKLDQGQAQEALDIIAPFEPVARKAFTGDNAPRLADFLVVLGRARAGVGYDAERFALAEANFLEAHPLSLAAPDRGLVHKDKPKCVQDLVDLYTAWHAAEPGKGYDAKAAQWRAKLPATESPLK